MTKFDYIIHYYYIIEQYVLSLRTKIRKPLFTKFEGNASKSSILSCLVGLLFISFWSTILALRIEPVVLSINKNTAAIIITVNLYFDLVYLPKQNIFISKKRRKLVNCDCLLLIANYVISKE